MPTSILSPSRQTGSANQRRSFGKRFPTIMGFHVFADPWNPIAMKRNEITQEVVMRLFNYDPLTGVLTAKTKVKKRQIGDVLGTADKRGYLAVSVNTAPCLIHRIAWLFMTGQWPAHEVDHINGNKGDNRFANLRAATRGENAKNRKFSSNNTSGVKGVCRHKRSPNWRAMVYVDGKQIGLGFFKTIEEAEKAVKRERERLHGEFVNHGISPQ